MIGMRNWDVLCVENEDYDRISEHLHDNYECVRYGKIVINFSYPKMIQNFSKKCSAE
jgi:hypothetical protein